MMMNLISLVTGMAGPTGFGSASTADQVCQGIDASHLTVILTGGSSGIGFETARVLAQHNAHLIIAARDITAANHARRLILDDFQHACVDVLELDLASLSSVRRFANSFISLNLPLNVLINNAGVMFCPYQLSQDGIEMQFATNHLGHFLLTNLLMEKMKETAKGTGVQGRIVNLSSIAHIHTYKHGILFQDINDKSLYSDKRAYGQSKLANILHAKELSRRLEDEGVNITANAVHPGLIMTPLFRYSAISMRILKLFSNFLWKNVAQGAATSCYVAAHPAMEGVSGKYLADCNQVEPSSFASDQILAARLWDLSNDLINSVSSKP